MEPAIPEGEKDLSELFGLEALSDEEQAEFVASIGTTLFQSALLTFTLALDGSEREAFEVFVAESGEGEALMENIILNYPAFANELNAEISRFRGEAVKILDPESEIG